MSDAALVATLSDATSLPADALRRAIAEPGLIAEPVLDALRRAGTGETLGEAEANLLFWGVHVLAGVRDTRLWRPLLALLRQDGDTLDAILGAAIEETFAAILNSVFDGDAEPLFALLLDSTTDDDVRCELFSVLTFLTQTGALPRQQAHDLLVRFDDKRAAVEEAGSWFAWEEAIALLGFGELTARVEAVNRDGRIERRQSDLPGFRKLLRDAETRPDDPRRFELHRHGILDDPVDALFWTEEAVAQEPVRNPFKHVGRNDPCPCGSGKKFKKCCLDRPAA